MLNFIPFARAWRKVTNPDGNAQVAGQILQSYFPPTAPAPIASTTLGSHQPFWRGSIAGAAPLSPPTADRFCRKARCLVIYSNAYPALVFRPIEDAVGNRFAALLIHQVGNSNLHRVAFWLPFPSAVLEVPDEFFLLGVDRNHRLTALLKGTPQGMDIFERFISIRMGIAFSRLAIALPAVARLVQQTAHGRV